MKMNKDFTNQLYSDIEFVILSAERSEYSELANIKRTRDLEEKLYIMNMPYLKAVGMYKGVSENSYIVHVKDFKEIRVLQTIAFDEYSQESILIKNKNNIGTLHFFNMDQVTIGTLKIVPDVSGLEAYTSVGTTHFTFE